jgi:outer membrane cobalamin receptor
MHHPVLRLGGCFTMLCLLAAVEAHSTEIPEVITVTASKVPEADASAIQMTSVVTGAELRARGARDLRTALSLLGGVDIAPGGDAGPGGAVPGLWGLQEFDAYLLVVDGVSYGGAFNPAVTTLDVTNVERIEVLRGAAPVMFGATSFVGVIQVIHARAGEARPTIGLSGGTRSTALADVVMNLPPGSSYRQSLVLNGETREFSQDDSMLRRARCVPRFGSDCSGNLRHRRGPDVAATGSLQPAPA